MATLKDLMQDVVNRTHSERVAAARACYREALDIVRRRVPLASNVSPTDFMYMLIGTAVCVDGTFSAGEKRMVMDLGLNVDDMLDYAQGALDHNFIQTLDTIVDRLNSDDKTTLVLLCLYIMGADETFTVSEQNVLYKLLA